MLVEQLLGDFLAIVFVEAPFAANRLVAFHQNVEPLSLEFVKVRHEPAFLAGTILLILVRLVDEAGMLET